MGTGDRLLQLTGARLRGVGGLLAMLLLLTSAGSAVAEQPPTAPAGSAHTRPWSLTTIQGAMAITPESSAESATAPARLLIGLHPTDGLAPIDGPLPRLSTLRRLPAAVQAMLPLGGTSYRVDLAPGTDLAQVSHELAAALPVRYIERDHQRTISQADPFQSLAVAPNDPAWEEQDEMRRVEAERAWELGTGDDGLVIAVVDTGVDGNHVDLAGRVLPGLNVLTDRPNPGDDNGHGTWVASVIAGAGNNRAGLAGLCWRCRILPVKVLSSRGSGPDSALATGLRFAADQGARLINVSLGGPNPSQTVEEAVSYATSKGALVIAAAGNEPDDRPNYPAAYPSVLAVAASGPTDNVTGFSTRAQFVDLAAPGINIAGALAGSRNGVRSGSGTSFAAPMVSGVAGLLLSLRPDLNSEALTSLLLDTAVDIGSPGRDNDFGAGRLAAYDASLAAARLAPSGGAELIVNGTAGTRQLSVATTRLVPGEAIRLWATGPNGRVHVRRGLQADAAGNLTTTLDLPPAAISGAYQVTARGDQSGRTAVATATIVTGGSAFQPIEPPADGRLYFVETRHSLGGAFQRYWESSGGLALFGFPISEEFQELNLSDGIVYTVQYFERNRFEFHPEQRDPRYQVQLGLLGSLLTADRIFPASPPLPTTRDRVYFAETNHTLSGDFLRYWEANGGLAIFGFPISEPFTERGRLVQYFERNRFELHAELPTAYRVSLGLLGSDLARRNGYV